MPKKIRKVSLSTLVSLPLITLPIVSAISCSNEISINYDFGLATSPINSLNYLKNKNTARVIPSIVEGAIKSGPKDKSLQNLLNMPEFKWRIANDTAFLGNYYDLKSIGYAPGVADDSTEEKLSLISHTNSTNPYAWDQVFIRINPRSRWSNAKSLQAKDFVDTIKYSLDINSGSQWILDVLELGIKNSNAIVQAQNDYFKEFGQTYINPFGYETYVKQKPWTLQATINKSPSEQQKEQIAINKIKNAARGLGIFTREAWNSYDTQGTNPLKDVKWVDRLHHDAGSILIEPKYQLYFQFEDAKPMGSAIIDKLSMAPYLLPTSRDFVEESGGIQKFGIDKEHIMWNGAFNPEDIKLGPQGYITLVKNQKYYASEKTISNRIKIYFQDDDIVTASMFKDGYISSTKIPAEYLMNFWSDESMRRYMKKDGGFGTIGLQMNIDGTGKANEALKDDDFRKAISYAVDRQGMLKMAGWDFSFPVTTWTAFGQVHDSSGTPIETYLDNQVYEPLPGATPLPIQSYSWAEHGAKSYTFEALDRKDIGYQPSLAQSFIQTYKSAHPNVSSVTLKYIYDSSKESRNVGIYLQSILNSTFGGFINLELKSLPSNVFEDYRNRGEFDLLYYNFDSYGTSIDSYVKRFFRTDKIIQSEQKTTGFINNPSGGWTYGDYFKKLRSLNQYDQKRLQLRVEENVWSKVEELATNNVNESLTDWTDRTDGFFSGLDKTGTFNTDWTTLLNVIEVFIAMEKIIRDTMPVIPLMEVDTSWRASRVGGPSGLFAFSLQYAYDVTRRNNLALPQVVS